MGADIKKLTIALVALIALAGMGALLVGPQTVLLVANYPRHGFADDPPARAPDYSDAGSWALYGGPGGNLGRQGAGDIGVFFVHPTGYFRGDHWNSRLDEASAASHNRRWMMANMASVFGDFPVYAPKYREATIYAFFDPEDADGQAALDFAYHDVRAAFDEFIRLNRGRPFILAGHSQGTLHGIRLLREVETGPHAAQLVAAYLAGGTRQSMTSGLLTPLCSGVRQTGCYVAWSTYGASYEAGQEELLDPYVCVNPVSWHIDGAAPAEEHKGMVPEVGEISFQITGDDKVPQVELPQLAAPVPAYTGARCDRGLLRVQIPNPDDFKNFTTGDYHNYDYALFHADVKRNLRMRVLAYLAAE